MEIITTISHLKNDSISYMQPGEISAEGNHLVFFLGHREMKRITMPKEWTLNQPVFFNRFGLSTGGEIRVTFKRPYRITITTISGNTRVE